MSRASLPPLEDDFSRALLGSAEADGPSPAAYAKAAGALGVGVGLGAYASLPASAAVAVSAAGAAGVARWSSSLAAKLLAVGMSGALVVGAGALLLRRSGPAQAITKTTRASGAHLATALPPNAAAPAPRAAAASPSIDRARPAVPRVSPGSPAAASLATPSGARRIARGVSSPAAAGHAPPAHASNDSSLAEQVQSLDRARLALGSGDSGAALREISRYRAAWPNGVFLTEASVLEIEALAARGERSLARARAADFVEAHPDSPQAARLRALIPNKKAN